MKDELGGKIMIEFGELRAKTYRYLRDDGSEDKKAKGTKECVIKRKLKFEIYENCLGATQPENETNHLEKKKINVDNLKTDLKEFIKNDKLIFKTQERFKSERDSLFTEEINKIALSLNDNKKMQ